MNAHLPALTDTPLVSVIIAARNNAPTLPACLEALRAQDYPHVEVILVDDGSTDATAAIGEAHGARVIATPPVGASVARNLGIDAARGEIAAFTDGDCVADAGWVRALVDGLRQSDATGVGGRQVNVFTAEHHASVDAFAAFFRAAAIVSDYTRADDRPRVVQHNPSCCSAYRIEAVRAVGGFSPDLWPGEDVDLDLRLAARGATFYYVPSALVHHHRPGTFAWFRTMMRRYGAAARRLAWRHGRRRSIDYLPAITAAVVAVQVLLLVPATRTAVVVADGVLVLSALGVLAATTPIRLWPAVVAFAITAMWEWHAGWWTARRMQA